MLYTLKYVAMVLGFIGFIFALQFLDFYLCSRFWWWKFPTFLYFAMKDVKEHPFVCHNCGRHFVRKWYHTFPFKAYAVAMTGGTNFKCPHCGKYDRCSVAKDEKIDEMTESD